MIMEAASVAARKALELMSESNTDRQAQVRAIVDYYKFENELADEAEALGLDPDAVRDLSRQMTWARGTTRKEMLLKTIRFRFGDAAADAARPHVEKVYGVAIDRVLQAILSADAIEQVFPEM